jgi:hypothetical protein
MIINLRFGGFFLFLLGFGVCVRINLWVFFLCSCVPVIRSVSFVICTFYFEVLESIVF